MSLCEIYEPKQVLQYICPIAISLATDRVADVRTIAVGWRAEGREGQGGKVGKVGKAKGGAGRGRVKGYQ